MHVIILSSFLTVAAQFICTYISRSKCLISVLFDLCHSGSVNICSERNNQQVSIQLPYC